MSVTQKPEHFDVIIVGAGMSGIGSAYHLHDQCSGKSFLILEEKENPSSLAAASSSRNV